MRNKFSWNCFLPLSQFKRKNQITHRSHICQRLFRWVPSTVQASCWRLWSWRRSAQQSFCSRTSPCKDFLPLSKRQETAESIKNCEGCCHSNCFLYCMLPRRLDRVWHKWWLSCINKDKCDLSPKVKSSAFSIDTQNCNLRKVYTIDEAPSAPGSSAAAPCSNIFWWNM